MHYLMFSLTTLFLLANPVVPTAPAGKATVDLSAEECAAAESLPDGFLEQALEVNAELDEELLLTTWQAHGCVDWALWGLIWLASLDAEVTFDVEVYETPELLTDFSHIEDGPPRISEVRIPPAPLLEENLREALQTPFEEQWRVSHLAAAGALSTVTVSGRRDYENDSNGYALFTFTRTGGHLDENLAVQFDLRLDGGTTTQVFSGFSPNHSTFTYEVDFTAIRQAIHVSINSPARAGGIGKYNYIVGGASSASVCAPLGCEPE